MAQVRTAEEWAAMTDEEYLKEAEMQIWLSAFAANNQRAPAHKETQKAYEEAVRRGNPELYNRAWKRAAAD